MELQKNSRLHVLRLSRDEVQKALTEYVSKNLNDVVSMFDIGVHRIIEIKEAPHISGEYRVLIEDLTDRPKER